MDLTAIPCGQSREFDDAGEPIVEFYLGGVCGPVLHGSRVCMRETHIYIYISMKVRIVDLLTSKTSQLHISGEPVTESR